MNAERFTFDTNILFYALDPTEAEKHKRARMLLNFGDPTRVPVLVQTLGEVCNAVLKRRPALAPKVDRLVQLLSVMYATVPTQLEDISDALWARAHHQIQFWDGVIWATARRAECSILLTEDQQNGRFLEGITFRDPFLMPLAELESFLLTRSESRPPGQPF